MVFQQSCQPKAGRPWAEKLMYYVYVLKSDINGKLYKGSTADLRNRVEEHNFGKVWSTKSATPWRLLYYEGFLDKKVALIVERFLKSGKGKERLKWLLGT